MEGEIVEEKNRLVVTIIIKKDKIEELAEEVVKNILSGAISDEIKHAINKEIEKVTDGMGSDIEKSTEAIKGLIRVVEQETGVNLTSLERKLTNKD